MELRKVPPPGKEYGLVIAVFIVFTAIALLINFVIL
jgi:hypothetical protein